MPGEWKSGFYRAFTNPALNGWGFVIGVAGLLLTVYTYWAQKAEPELLARPSAVRTVLVAAEAAADLQVLADGRPVKGPVTAVQVVVWNAGKAPIREENVLEPLKLSLEGSAPIISARVLRVTRDLTRFSLDESQRANGVLGLRFRILEAGDGALVQLTYLGGEGVAIKGSGAIVGQSAFEVATAPQRAEDRSRQPSASGPGWFGTVVIAGLVAGVGVFFYSMLRDLKNEWRGVVESWRATPRRWPRIVNSVFGILFWTVMMYGVTYIFVTSVVTKALQAPPPFPV